MVAVAHAAPQTSGPEAIAAWLAGLAGIYPQDDIAGIAAALEYARTRVGTTTGRDGEPLQERALGTATILAGLKLDAGAVRAALLLGLPGAGAFDVEAVTDAFGADVAALVAGVAADGRHPRAARHRQRRRPLGAGREPAQDAAGDGARTSAWC